MILSKRLQTVADMIPPSAIYADIGCDHGYLPIYLVSMNKADRAIATDLRKGPLSRAREHVREYGLEDRIELRLSDGADALSVKDAIDTITVTGMGGRLLLRIIQRGDAVFRAARDIFVSPQSDIPLVRKKLSEEGYAIVDETMAEDAGKYYVILHLKPATTGALTRELSPAELMYGACIHTKKDPVLYDFLI
ncbi:MAG: SAM-dependent methyltransferase, partial [Lachnospiraceae bacterium]|nr:SAM-dependent methyltransferase [Lachnospiraceae bacterium]